MPPGGFTAAGLNYNYVVHELTPEQRLERVREQLKLYDHPVLTFDAHIKGDSVEIFIRFRDASVPVHTYYFELHPRDLDSAQFEWQFQRQLYDCLHDYLIEMFTRTPQDRKERIKIDGR